MDQHQISLLQTTYASIDDFASSALITLGVVGAEILCNPIDDAQSIMSKVLSFSDSILPLSFLSFWFRIVI